MRFFGPRSNRTQIFLEVGVTNGTAIVYTVPADKLLYLIEASLHLTSVNPATGLAEVSVRNAADEHVRDLCSIDIGSNPPFVPTDHFEPAYFVEVPAGYDIVVTSSAASLAAEGDIFGFLVKA